MNKAGERLYNGLIKENPTFVLMLGMCPTLAVTTSAVNGLGMGLTTAAVLALSNLIISLLRKIIPNRVRIPAFIVIIASFVTVLQLLLEAYLPFLNKALGVYIPLIVVNCIILGRAESYAYSNPPVPSLFDGVGMGLGFTFALTCIGAVRELLGTGKVFNFSIMPSSYTPVGIFVLAPGAFFVLAALTAFQNYLKRTREQVGKEASKIQSGCSEDCMNCSDTGCSRRFYDNSVQPAKKEDGNGRAGKSLDGRPSSGKSMDGSPLPDAKAAVGKASEGKAAAGKTSGKKASEGKLTGGKSAGSSTKTGSKEPEIIDLSKEEK